MDTDLEALATALYVTVDDLLIARPEAGPPRPRVGLVARTSGAEIITLAVMQALLGCTSERHWIRHAHRHLRGMFPHVPGQSGWSKRLRALAGTMSWLITTVGRSTSVWDDALWPAGSTPIECARSRPTVKRSEPAGWAQYGYCASRSRYFWGLRLHLVTTPHGLPVAWALTSAKADERQTRARRHCAEEGPPDHRIRLRHPQGPARPRAPQRSHDRRRHSPHHPTHPGPDNRHLAQRPHRQPHPALPDPLRPLTTPWNQSSRRVRVLRWDSCTSARNLGGLPTSSGRFTTPGCAARGPRRACLTERGWRRALDWGCAPWWTCAVHARRPERPTVSGMDSGRPHRGPFGLGVPARPLPDPGFPRVVTRLTAPAAPDPQSPRGGRRAGPGTPVHCTAGTGRAWC